MPELLAARSGPQDAAAPYVGYRWHVGDLRTGKITRSVELVGGSWSVPLGDAGALEGSFPLRSGKWPAARSDAAVAKAFLAASYVNADGTETILEAGPIWKSDFQDDETGMLQIGAAGLASYFDHRKVIPVLAAGDNPATATVTYTGQQRGLIAKRLVELAQSHTGGNLPIVLPDDADLGGAGTKYTQTYPGYELGWVGERLRQLSELGETDDSARGPEIQFVPRFAADKRYVEWVMRIGTEPSMMLTQTGPAWVFDRTVRKSPVRKISVASDGTEMAFKQWAAGQGEAEGRPIVWAEDDTLVDLGFPLLEGEVTATDTVSTTETLNAHATGALAYSQRPIESWTLTVSRDTRPNVGQYAPGDWATVRVKDHVFIPDGDYSMRILSKAGDTSDAVTLTLSERLGDI